MSRQRRKLATDGAAAIFRTVRDGGYQLVAPGRGAGGWRMISLRDRIALLMIISVTALASLTAVQLIQRPLPEAGCCQSPARSAC